MRVKTTEDGSGRTKKGKQRWTQNHLPFPGGQPRVNCLRIWRNQFAFTLIAWAGGRDDTFGANQNVGEAIDKIWPILYSQLALDDAGRTAVIGNVSTRMLSVFLVNHPNTVTYPSPLGSDHSQPVAQSSRR